ncbi:MAG: hypothetical protein ABMB14_03235 [Myxococcota bacterium]
MYTPSFLEIFLAYALVVVWARWLRDRTPIPAFVAAIPWLAGAAVLAGQLAGVSGVLQESTGAAPLAGSAVSIGRWGSLAVVGVSLVVELGLTGWSVIRGSR